MKKNRWIIISVLILILLATFFILKNRGKGAAELVQVEMPAYRTIIETVVASGKVFPEFEVKISSDVSGEIVELYVQEGDSVVQGQLLAKIDPDIYVSNVERGEAALNSSKSQMSQAMAQVQNAIAQKEQIEAQLINARTIYNRSKNLRNEGVISAQEFEASEASFRGLEANLKAAEASIKAAEINVEASRFAVKSSEASLKELKTSLQRTSIFSPISGIVSRLDVEKGERVVGTIQMTGTEMMRISNFSNMEVQVEVSENDIIRVNLDDEVEIEVDAYVGKKFNGNVTQIASSANSPLGTTNQQLSTDQVANFIVRIRIDPESYSSLVQQGLKYPFRPGMSASVSIATQTQANVLSVPIQAVTTRDLSSMRSNESQNSAAFQIKEVVFVMSGDTVRIAEVSTGIQDDTYIWIKEGLTETDRVVVGPYSAISRTLKSGSSVKIDSDARRSY